MSHPDLDILVDLALGDESTSSEADRDHVGACAECSSAVAELQHTRMLVGTPDRLDSPPPGLWDRIEQAIDDQEQPLVAPTSLTERRARRRWVPAAIAGAAAAGIAVGALGGHALWGAPTPEPAPLAQTVASAQLDTLDTHQWLGMAQLVRTDSAISLRVDAQPMDPGPGYLEVWLINKDGKRMVSVGVLRGNGAESFPVTQALIDQGYVIVDISKEGFDNLPAHSGDSLARGTLA